MWSQLGRFVIMASSINVTYLLIRYLATNFMWGHWVGAQLSRGGSPLRTVNCVPGSFCASSRRLLFRENSPPFKSAVTHTLYVSAGPRPLTELYSAAHGAAPHTMVPCGRGDHPGQRRLVTATERRAVSYRRRSVGAVAR